jgi:tetratricopeptide (TPR) repeat protein
MIGNYTLTYDADTQELIAQASIEEKKGNFSTASVLLTQAYNKNPNNTLLAYKVACFYASIGSTELALDVFKKLLQTSPHNVVQTMYNIGYICKSTGKIDQAIYWYKKALEIDPNYEPAEFAIGLAYLNKGNFKQGWKIHENHLIKKSKNSEILRSLIEKNSLKNKIILIRPDGGMGDTIQFIRYARLLKELGAYTIAAAQEPLIPLLKRCPYLDEVVSVNSPLPACHDWCAVMSLPSIFNSTQETIPLNIPYLYPDEQRCKYWKQFLKKNTINVGICWQADVHNDSSRPPFARRGIPLEELITLSSIEHVQLYSLQQKDGLEQIKNNVHSQKLITFDSTFDTLYGPFMDTAALMSHIDLVITVDTAVAHLAGALGSRVWLLLPYCTDWRWIVGRSDSPWYPSMKIFKQPKPFDWKSVIHEVQEELVKLVMEKIYDSK